MFVGYEDGSVDYQDAYSEFHSQACGTAGQTIHHNLYGLIDLKPQLSSLSPILLPSLMSSWYKIRSARWNGKRSETMACIASRYSK